MPYKALKGLVRLLRALEGLIKHLGTYKALKGLTKPLRALRDLRALYGP